MWGRVIGRLRGGTAPAPVSLVVLLGVLPVLLGDGPAVAVISAVVFGSAFMAGPSSITVLARLMLPQRAWTSGIAWLTVAFSVGQAVGPLVSGCDRRTAGPVRPAHPAAAEALGEMMSIVAEGLQPDEAGADLPWPR